MKPFRNPHNLPVKICEACGRPFVWRKKWSRDWPGVRFCSDRCRAQPPARDGHKPGAGKAP